MMKFTEQNPNTLNSHLINHDLLNHLTLFVISIFFINWEVQQLNYKKITIPQSAHEQTYCVIQRRSPSRILFLLLTLMYATERRKIGARWNSSHGKLWAVAEEGAQLIRTINATNASLTNEKYLRFADIGELWARDRGRE